MWPPGLGPRPKPRPSRCILTYACAYWRSLSLLSATRIADSADTIWFKESSGSIYITNSYIKGAHVVHVMRFSCAVYACSSCSYPAQKGSPAWRQLEHTVLHCRAAKTMLQCHTLTLPYNKHFNACEGQSAMQRIRNVAIHHTGTAPLYGVCYWIHFFHGK